MRAHGVQWWMCDWASKRVCMYHSSQFYSTTSSALEECDIKSSGQNQRSTTTMYYPYERQKPRNGSHAHSLTLLLFAVHCSPERCQPPPTRTIISLSYWFQVLTILHRTDNVSPFFYYYYTHRAAKIIEQVIGEWAKSLKYYAYTSPPLNTQTDCHADA